jgi:two-component system sensor histidine kinase UhpB
MASDLGFLRKIQRILPNLSLRARIAIGNSVIMIAGALLGTIITHNLTERGEELALLLLVTAGITFSILFNYLIISSALKPLVTLHSFVEEIQAGEIHNPPPRISNPDPQTGQLIAAVTGLLTQLETSNQQLRVTSRRAIHAQEEERKRIAGWLHDDTGQTLVTLILKLERLENSLAEDAAPIRSRLAESRQLAASALDSLRKVITGLRPSILDDLGLIPAIRWYGRTNLEEAGIRFHFQLPEDPAGLPPEISITLFRVAQESINNIVRHSKAHNATLTLQIDPDRICLRVEDDGLGFIPAPDQSEAIRQQQWGLIGIQERVTLVGGDLQLTSEPGKGTLIEVSMPITKNQEPPNG